MKPKTFAFIAFALASLALIFVVVRTTLIEQRYASIAKNHSFEEMVHIVCEDQSLPKSRVFVTQYRGTFVWKKLRCQGSPLDVQNGFRDVRDSIHFQSFRSLLVARNVSIVYGEDGRFVGIGFSFRPFF